MSVHLSNRFSVLVAAPEDQTRKATPAKANRPSSGAASTSTSTPTPTFNRSSASDSVPQTKLYFKILQAVHHLEILDSHVEKGTCPPGMKKQVVKLSQFIKPSSPNDTTFNKINDNTINWLHTNLQILHHHYDDAIQAFIPQLRCFAEADYERALQWGRARYRHKLTPSSITILKDILISNCPPVKITPTKTAPELSPTDFPPLPPPTSATSASPPLPSTEPEGDPRGPLSHPVLPARSPTREVVAAVHHNPVITPTPPSPEPSPPHGIPPSPPPLLTFPLPSHPSPITHCCPLSPSPPSAPLSPSRTSPPPPLAPRLPTVRYTNVIAPANDSITFSPLSPTDTLDVQSTEPEPPLPNCPGSPPSIPAATKSDQTVMMSDIHVSEPLLNSPTVSESITVASREPPVAPPRSPGRPEPHRHPTTFRKILDWSLTVHKPHLIIGDSNLSRIPTFKHPDVQIDSFPGATFHHINSIIKKLPPQPTPHTVIISAGLNNCLQEQVPLTTWKQLQQLLRTAQSTFPSAKIYIPVINFSDQLSTRKQTLINKLNQTIISKCTFLPELDPSLFQVVDSDPVHWTPQTASTILHYWCKQLNF